MGCRIGRWLLSLAVLLAAPGVQASEPVLVAMVGVVPPSRVRDLEQAMARVRPAAMQLVPSATVRARIASDRSLWHRRKLAATMLKKAVFLSQRLRYDQALRKLRQAEIAALDGLARFVEPRLLSDIYFHQGLALLPTDRSAGHRQLVQSFLLWPTRVMNAEQESPKILKAARTALVEAQTGRSQMQISGREAARVATLLHARLLLVVSLRRGPDKDQVSLALFEGDTPRRSAMVQLLSDDPPQTIRLALERAFRRFFPAERETAGSSPRLRRWKPWAAVGLGMAAAGLTVGTVLAVMTSSRENEAESLARREPLVEYAPQVLELEQEGQRMQAGSIICFCLAGVGAAAALAAWFWPDRSERHGTALLLGPRGVQLVIDLP